MSEKVSRRGYVKYAAAGVVVVAVAAGGGYYYRSRQAPRAPGKLKIVYLLNETTDDMSWDLYYVTDAKWTQQRYGDKVEVTWQLLIPFPDMEKTARDYAEKGYGLIHGCGVQWADPLLAAAPDYPNVQFVFTCAPKHTRNATSVVWREEQMGFLNGVMAHLMGAKMVGIIGASDVPCANSFGNGVISGLEYMGSKAEFLTGYAGSWGDPVKGKQLAISMINSGADFIAHSTAMTGLGVFEACKERNVYTMGMYRDQRDASGIGDLCLGSILYHNELAMDELVPNLLAGNPPLGMEIPADFQHGYFEMSELSPLVPGDVKKKFMEIVDGIKNGTIGVPRSEKPIA